MIPDSDTTTPGYADAAPLYWQAGWRGILPLPQRAKHSPPRGFTGGHDTEPSYPDLCSWAELYPAGNLCLRLPDTIIGIDVDDYGAKNGAATLTEAEKRWGALPPTIRSTSREDGASGIRLYRVPAGTRLADRIEFPELGIGDIEICQHRHRYVIAWPSTHPEGRTYWWLNADAQHVPIPHPADLPDLPAGWITNLPYAAVTPILTGQHYRTRNALTPGQPSQKVAERLRQAIKELNLAGSSRHDTTRGHVLALLRLGKSGQPGVERAMLALGEMFIALVSPDRAGGKDEATREYKSMVAGEGAARNLAQPGLADWTAAIAAGVQDAPQPTSPPRRDHTDPEPLDHDPGPEPESPPAPAPAAPDGIPYSHFDDIERGFWDSRDSLKAVWTTAMSRMCSPWAVLAHCAARALTQVRPNVTLPPLIGGPGSLNWFAAVTAVSGGGKGSAASAAKLLVPADTTARNLGSGEGLVAAFAGDRQDPDSAREAIMFTADEIDTITALGSRVGSTLMGALRSAFSGEQLGFSYADRDKRRTLPAHSYRMTLVMSVQPERAAALIGDAGGGTPQRFMWFPGTDSRITDDPPWESGPLTLPPPGEWQYPRTLTIPAEARALILAERVKAMRGQAGALDGHALFVREKFAFALAVLDGRTDITSEDWELSGIAADISTYTRELVLDALKDAADRDAAQRGAVRGIEMDASDVERSHQQVQRAQRVLRWVLRKLDEAGDEGLTERELTQKAASRDRVSLPAALLTAVAEGLAKRCEQTGKWVKL